MFLCFGVVEDTQLFSLTELLHHVAQELGVYVVVQVGDGDFDWRWLAHVLVVDLLTRTISDTGSRISSLTLKCVGFNSNSSALDHVVAEQVRGSRT